MRTPPGKRCGLERLRVLCLLPRMYDSRIAKRIDMLKELGHAVEALGFERDQDSGRAPDCPVESLGHIRGGHYPARIRTLLRSAPRVRRAARRSEFIYAFNTDLALLALVATVGLDIPVALETADIREMQVAADWRGRLVRALDRLATQRCRLLVITASEYQDYYRDWLGTVKRALVIENKIDASFAASVSRHASDTHISGGDRGPRRIAWFGMLRDEWTWRVLEKVITEDPGACTAVLAGVGMLDDFANRVLKRANVEYLGEYAHPEGLPRIYRAVDIVIACYPTSIPGSWSRSNRYYEACLFNRPLIVRAGCADAGPVGRLDIGLVIDTPSIDAAAAAIRAVTAQDLKRWRTNLTTLRESEYTATDEAAVLGKAIADAVANSVVSRGIAADG